MTDTLPVATHRLLRYTSIAMLLHWLMALMIFAALAMGWYMVDLRISPDKLRLYSWHKWLGVTIFALAAMRLCWRLWHPAPPLPSMAVWQRNAARLTHLTMYVLFFAIPVSGWLFSSAKGIQTVYLGLLPLPDLVTPNEALAALLKLVHLYAGYGLAALIVLHIGAAVYHELTDQQSLIRRMLPSRWWA